MVDFISYFLFLLLLVAVEKRQTHWKPYSDRSVLLLMADPHAAVSTHRRTEAWAPPSSPHKVNMGKAGNYYMHRRIRSAPPPLGSHCSFVAPPSHINTYRNGGGQSTTRKRDRDRARLPGNCVYEPGPCRWRDEKARPVCPIHKRQHTYVSTRCPSSASSAAQEDARAARTRWRLSRIDRMNIDGCLRLV